MRQMRQMKKKNPMLVFIYTYWHWNKGVSLVRTDTEEHFRKEDLSIKLDLLPGIVRRKWIEKKRKMQRVATWAGTSGRLVAQAFGGGAAIARPPAVTASRGRQILGHLVAPTTPSLGIRTFAAIGQKPKVEDGTLEGRYATALFMATSDRLDKVYGDLAELRDMMQESKEFRLMVETPGIDTDSKTAALEAICSQTGSDQAVVNFLKVLIENKRMHKLEKMIELYEGFYRAEGPGPV